MASSPQYWVEGELKFHPEILLQFCQSYMADDCNSFFKLYYGLVLTIIY